MAVGERVVLITGAAHGIGRALARQPHAAGDRLVLADLDGPAVDGCSFFGIYWRIILPLVKPALAAAATFSFLHHWNDFFHPVIYINSIAKWTLALGLNNLRRVDTSGGFDTDMNMLMAASVVIMLPPLLVFFFAQKYFIQGVVFTGVKG